MPVSSKFSPTLKIVKSIYAIGDRTSDVDDIATHLIIVCDVFGLIHAIFQLATGWKRYTNKLLFNGHTDPNLTKLRVECSAIRHWYAVVAVLSG